MNQPPRPSGNEQTKTYRRQVLAGDAVRPAPDPWARATGTLPMTMLQRNFLLAILALVIVSGLLVWLDLVLLATVPLFLLALLLIGGRFVF